MKLLELIARLFCESASTTRDPTIQPPQYETRSIYSDIVVMNASVDVSVMISEKKTPCMVQRPRLFAGPWSGSWKWPFYSESNLAVILP